MIFLRFITLIVALECVSLSQNQNTLKFVHIVYRHGDRTPTQIFPKDIHNGPSTWYNGLGELTPVGMRQHYQLGTWFRNKYNGFINDTYDQTQIYVRSTNYNRTIMSALSNLAGLYPPVGKQDWNHMVRMPWQPIPVHARDRDHDFECWTDLHCPTVDNLYQSEVETKPEIVQLTKQWTPYFNFLSEKSGASIKGFGDINIVVDPITVEWWNKDFNPPREIPMMSWINKTVVDKLLQVFDLKDEYWYFGSPGINRLRGGPLLGDIMNRMDQKRNDTLDHRLKMYFYSAHDTTVVALLKALGVRVSKAVPYACAIIIELHESPNGQWTVKTSFKNDTNEFNVGGPAVDLTVGNCSSPCTLDKFIERSKPLVPNDWYAECGLKSSSGNSINSFAPILICLIAILYPYKFWTSLCG